MNTRPSSPLSGGRFNRRQPGGQIEPVQQAGFAGHVVQAIGMIFVERDRAGQRRGVESQTNASPQDVATLDRIFLPGTRSAAQRHASEAALLKTRYGR